MSTSTVVWIIVAIIIIGGLVWYFVAGTQQGATVPNTQTQTIQNAGGSDSYPNGTPGANVSASTSVNY